MGIEEGIISWIEKRSASALTVWSAIMPLSVGSRPKEVGCFEATQMRHGV